MIKRIHILGASASGTTTLAKALCQKLGYIHFDTDNFYWVPTKVPFTQKRNVEERQELLKNDLEKTSNWILSGSLCGWGDIFIPYFDLVVCLFITTKRNSDKKVNRKRQTKIW